MKNATRGLLGAFAVCAWLLAAAAPAHAEGITLSYNGASQGTFACASGCFGNDITLDVSGGGTNWDVTLTFDTTNNNNQGDFIGAVDFVLSGFSYDGVTNLSVTDDTTTTTLNGWNPAEGPTASSGSGCGSSTANHICGYDASLFVLPFAGPDGNEAALDGSTYSWVWTIEGQSFAGFDSNTHIGAVFGKDYSRCSIPGSGGDKQRCFKETGQISTGVGALPEPTSLTLLGIGLGFVAVIRRRITG